MRQTSLRRGAKNVPAPRHEPRGEGEVGGLEGNLRGLEGRNTAIIAPTAASSIDRAVSILPSHEWLVVPPVRVLTALLSGIRRGVERRTELRRRATRIVHSAHAVGTAVCNVRFAIVVGIENRRIGQARGQISLTFPEA